MTDEMTLATEHASALAEIERLRAEVIECNRIDVDVAEQAEAQTVEAIAAMLLGNDMANACGVDLTNPRCPVGVTLTIAARAVKSGAWKRGAK